LPFSATSGSVIGGGSSHQGSGRTGKTERCHGLTKSSALLPLYTQGSYLLHNKRTQHALYLPLYLVTRTMKFREPLEPPRPRPEVQLPTYPQPAVALERDEFNSNFPGDDHDLCVEMFPFGFRFPIFAAELNLVHTAKRILAQRAAISFFRSMGRQTNTATRCVHLRGVDWAGALDRLLSQNTNVIELYARIDKKNGSQLTYYNSGIGTYARPSWRSYKYWKQVIGNRIDLAIAWYTGFSLHTLGAPAFNCF
jgi:hypothetical protein